MAQAGGVLRWRRRAPPSGHAYRVPWAVAVCWCGLAGGRIIQLQSQLQLYTWMSEPVWELRLADLIFAPSASECERLKAKGLSGEDRTTTSSNGTTPLGAGDLQHTQCTTQLVH